MPLSLAIFVAIFLSPFFLMFFVYLGISIVLSWLFVVIETPIKLLHDVVTKEGEKVKHATQFIIYFISWPFIFLLYIIYAFTAVSLTILYIYTSIMGYIASLGGYKFHVAPTTECIEKEMYKSKYVPQSLVFIIINAVAIITLAIVLLIIFSNLYRDYMEETFIFYFIPSIQIYFGIYVVFCYIYIPISYCSRDKLANKPESVQEQPEEKNEEEEKEKED